MTENEETINTILTIKQMIRNNKNQKFATTHHIKQRNCCAEIFGKQNQ